MLVSVNSMTAENGVSVVFPGSSDGVGNDRGGIEHGHEVAGTEQGNEGAGIEHGNEGAGTEQGCGTVEMEEEDIRTHSEDTPLSLGTQVSIILDECNYCRRAGAIYIGIFCMR